MNMQEVSRENHGLYRSEFEHDNCGIGAVVNIKGKKTHDTVANALRIVEHLEHRAGKDAEGKTGDGVGILLQISHKFFKKACKKEGFEIGDEREYGIAQFFFPQHEIKRAQAKKMFEIIVEKEGLELLGWRTVPVIPEVLGHKARECIGGGDTGNDCVGTSIRLGAKSVTQLEMMPKPPAERAANNPWPEWPRILKTDYGQEEAIAVFGHDPRVYQTTVTEFIADKKGNVCKAKIVKLKPQKDEKTGRMMMVPVEGTEEVIPADVVLIAAGFLGSQKYVTDAFKVNINGRTNVETKPEAYETSVQRVFTAGDMHRGQSLVVWAIREGREAARAVDESLMGYTNL